jgi:predicted 3-demethylubiquinone-9 3-methyltransferase (glyoxalase superfamily)
MPRTTPCLWFDTQAKDAAEFYCSVFPNSRITQVQHYGEAGPREAGMVMVVEFELDGQPYQALNGGPEFRFDEAISFDIRCADQAELDHYWSKLGEGGQEGPCGWLKDRFGLSWQVTPQALVDMLADPDPAKVAAVTKTFLSMSKLDVAPLQAAYDAA